jgi:hypothetical protein
MTEIEKQAFTETYLHTVVLASLDRVALPEILEVR